jgi:nitroreductase
VGIKMEDVKEKILDAFYFRHACKKFDGSKKISDNDFNFILETARLSPSSFGIEPWKFLVLQNMNIREKIGGAAWGAKEKLPDASHFIIILARKTKDLHYDSDFISNFMVEVQKFPEEVIKARKKSIENFQKSDFKLLDNENGIFEWACRQTYIALGNMLTAAAEIGIDSCPIEGFDREKVEKILADEKLIDLNEFGVSCMAAFGYRAKEPREKTRQTIDEIVQWVY